MNKQYNEIMDNIKVTDEMRNRIMQNIQRADISSTEKTKTFHFLSFKRYLAFVACFALVLGSAIMVPRLLNPNGLTHTGDIITVASAEELSTTMGFEVKDIVNIPFTVEKTAYNAYWKEFAEIKYIGTNQALTYRKSSGTDINSGDYTHYDVAINKELQDVTIEIKGTGDLYYTATWNNKGYSYSFFFDNGIYEAALVSLLESNIE
ncbi:MAG: hypothetical protein PHX62_05435 [Bacilli bacterium]|nr:hypothetical protein [Bacilli bacterium]